MKTILCCLGLFTAVVSAYMVQKKFNQYDHVIEKLLPSFELFNKCITNSFVTIKCNVIVSDDKRIHMIL